jgi:F0F1-type ATP synthase alpha subunit
MDDIEINKVLKFEQMLYNKLDTTHKSLGESIINKKILDEEIEN